MSSEAVSNTTHADGGYVLLLLKSNGSDNRFVVAVVDGDWFRDHFRYILMQPGNTRGGKERARIVAGAVINRYAF